MAPDPPAAEPNPLDAMLRQIAEEAPSDRARAWARRLLTRGEAATGSVSSPPPRPTHVGSRGRRGSGKA